MSDPFETLRGTGPSRTAPDLSKIKARARQITRRRQLMLGSSAAVIAVMAVIGTIATTGNDPDRVQASRQQESSADQQTRSGSSSASGGATAAPTPVPSEGTLAAGTTTDQSGPAAQAGEATTGSAAAGRVENTSLEATVEVREATLTTATRFTLKLCNQNPNEVTRSFNSGQRYDFEVKRGPDLVWRWSDDQVFTQVTGQETWKPNECKTWAEEWNGQTSSGSSALPGQYHVTGVLKSSPEQRTKTQAFCLASC